MAGKVLDLDKIVVPDHLAHEIARRWMEWDGKRDKWKKEKVELRNYIFATDTTDTSASRLPWSNKTHIPKICQIRDNLFANYLASMFPKRKWMKWQGDTEEDQAKEEAIRDYMTWCTQQNWFRDEFVKLILDYIDYGNVFATVEWIDTTTMMEGERVPGFVGPKPVRLNPLDLVMNPVAPDSRRSPKIVRSTLSIGEAKEQIEAFSGDEQDKEVAKKVFDELINMRQQATQYGGDFKELDEFYNVDGFDTYRNYLGSDYMELLTFYGDIYDHHSNELKRDHVIVVADRHKVIYDKPHPKLSGKIPIFHSGWRVRQDNLWAMGPLDNLVGMQYRIDHVENMKADIFDLTVYPPLKVKGMVEDFEWGPFERIYTDNDGDVELMSPKADILTANVEIQGYEQRMEEMAGSPKEAMGIRSPGEKTKYEVQRLENAASRVFQSKIKQFEEQVMEPVLNEMLALARKNLNTATIRLLDDELKITEFKKITREQLSAMGTLKPVAARHFAEQAELIQNLTQFSQSPIAESIKPHISTVKLAALVEEIMAIEDYEIISPFVAIAEEAEGQSLAMTAQEQVQMEAQTPAGIAGDDYDEEPIPAV